MHAEGEFEKGEEDVVIAGACALCWRKTLEQAQEERVERLS
jgi:hypothetical protein